MPGTNSSPSLRFHWFVAQGHPGEDEWMPRAELEPTAVLEAWLSRSHPAPEMAESSDSDSCYSDSDYETESEAESEAESCDL